MSATCLPALHRAVLLAAGVVVIAAGLNVAAGTVNLVLVSVLLAMSVSPIPYLLQRRGMKHGPAVLLAILLVSVGGVLVLGSLAGALTGLQQKLPVYETKLSGLMKGIESWLTGHGIDLNQLFKPNAGRVVELAGGIVRGALEAMGYGFFVLILVALILFELPARHGSDPPTGAFRDRFDEVSIGVRRFVGITGMIGAGQSAANFVVMLAVGTDFAFVWAVLFFLLSFIPFGFAIGIVPALAVTLLEHGVTRAIVLLILLVVLNSIGDNVVKPKLMGKGLGLSPLVIMLSLIFWSFVLGPIGAILAVPLTIAITTVLPLVSGPAPGAPPAAS